MPEEIMQHVLCQKIATKRFSVLLKCYGAFSVLTLPRIYLIKDIYKRNYVYMVHQLTSPQKFSPSKNDSK